MDYIARCSRESIDAAVIMCLMTRMRLLTGAAAKSHADHLARAVPYPAELCATLDVASRCTTWSEFEAFIASTTPK